ncbi:TetR/AcrR family transcriptional regulator [Nocardia sp. BMG111209]|uniref:TetR/AcrR family transcriptional regulator n=1 Tax=Nocardia sp. BMG111209 TaxID=1160137 RepID=UPI001E655556|nr:TetR family transcriptional regulator [Nocardia sp. BMG111209]
MIVEQPGRLLDGGLRSEDVINSANSSHATFYRKFTAKPRYLAAVLDRLADTATLLPADVRGEAHAVLAAAGGDRRQALRALIQTHFDALFEEAVGTRRLLASMLGTTEPSAARTIRAGYQHGDQLIMQIFEVFFAHSGVTLRKPFTMRSFCLVITALLEGFLVRSRSEPQSVTPELVADAILAVLGIAVDSRQQHGHIDDVLTSIAAPRGLSVRLPSEPRVALLKAARNEFTKRGYFMATVEAMAEEAGVPLDAALRIFPTKLHVIVGALKSHYDKLAEAIADDVALGRGVVTVVERHFLRCARLVESERPFMDALLAAVAHDTYAEPDGLLSIKRELNFPGLLLPLLEQGQQERILVTDQSAADLAALLTNTLLLRCFTRRNASPEQNAAFVSRLVLDGLRGR